jgi:hypothetical protein
MEKNRNDMTKVIAGVSASVLALAGVAVFLLSSEKVRIFDFLLVATVLLLVLGAMVIFWKRNRDIKAGLPVEDELLLNVSNKAGSYAYFAFIAIAMVLFYYNYLAMTRPGLPQLTVENTIGTLILLSGVAYMVFYFYLNRKGNVE